MCFEDQERKLMDFVPTASSCFQYLRRATNSINIGPVSSLKDSGRTKIGGSELISLMSFCSTNCIPVATRVSVEWPRLKPDQMTHNHSRLDRERESNENVKNTVILYAIVILLTNRLGGIYMTLSVTPPIANVWLL